MTSYTPVELYEKLNDIFAQDDQIDELGLLDLSSLQDFGPNVVTYASDSKDGVAFVLTEHKLAISFWCIPLVFGYALKKFNVLWRQWRAAAPVSSPSVSAVVPPSVLLAKHRDEFLSLTRALLLVNADHYTAWNMRKQLLMATRKENQQDTLSAELRFLTLVFSKHPKSGESWAHRRWVLGKLDVFSAASPPAPDDLVGSSCGCRFPGCHALYDSALFKQEVKTAELSAELYPKNYYAWTHLQWLAELLHCPSLVLAELRRMRKWTSTHVSDYCGFHQRQVLLLQYARAAAALSQGTAPFPPSSSPTASKEALDTRAGCNHNHQQLLLVPRSDEMQCDQDSKTRGRLSDIQSPSSALKRSCECCTAWLGELSYVDELQSCFSAHETLWCHRRFLFQTYSRMILDHAAVRAASSVSNSSLLLALLALVSPELSFSQSHIDNDTLENHANEKRFAQAYQSWVLQTSLWLLDKQTSASDAVRLAWKTRLDSVTKSLATNAPIRSLWVALRQQSQS